MGLDITGSEALKQAIGQAIIDKIQDRTQKGISLAGKAFRKYSKAYKASDDFKAAGKTSKVNLRLSGDMLETMDIVDETKNTITIGWDDSDDAGKAHGHITGGGSLPKRDFFGLRPKDIASLKAEFADDVKDIKSTRGDSRKEAILALAKKLSGDG